MRLARALLEFRNGGEGEEALVGALMIARFLMDSHALAAPMAKMAGRVTSFIDALRRR